MASYEASEKPIADKGEKALQFLTACVRHSKFQIDWAALVEEQDIVSVNAARKRLKRLVDAHGGSAQKGKRGLDEEWTDYAEDVKKGSPAKKPKFQGEDGDGLQEVVRLKARVVKREEEFV